MAYANKINGTMGLNKIKCVQTFKELCKLTRNSEQGIRNVFLNCFFPFLLLLDVSTFLCFMFFRLLTPILNFGRVFGNKVHLRHPRSEIHV